MSMDAIVEGPVERLIGGLGFTEGPVWLAEHGQLLFTDIPANRIHRWDPAAGLSTWVDNAHLAIGLSRDGRGRVLACEHSTRCLSAIEVRADGGAGARHVLARSFAGCVLNSTNDVICASDGTVLFTDPPFGVRELEGALHGYQQATELSACHVFRVTDDPDAPVPVISGIYRPNGLCLSPDESRLYVSDSSQFHHKVLVADVGPGWRISGLRDFAIMPVGVPDGMRVDIDGNVWIVGGDGIHVHGPDGTRMGHVPVPEMVTNLEFGGDDRRDVYITATTSLYQVRALRPGAARPPLPAA